jgi:hypothetical protein
VVGLCGVTDHPRLAAAREALRARFDEQQQALADYYGLERKAQRLRDELAGLETKMRAALGRLARATDASTAARLTGAPLRHARAAVGEGPTVTGPRSGNAASLTPPTHPEVE